MKIRAQRTLAVLLASGSLACGGPDGAVVPEAAARAPEPTEISSGVNVCPHFEGSLVMPQKVRPEEHALIMVRATDPDAPDSSLAFAWQAANGSFSVLDQAVTRYRCAELGSEQLTVTATDRQGCSSDLKLVVDCIAN